MSPKLPRTTAKKVLQALLRAGFYVHHQTGSHVNLRHENKKHLHVVIPMHSGDLSIKTVHSIIVQSEVDLISFIALL
jgi:predicted RNA binding protein YcfA (HicA-like mRNA interferase family)